MRSTALVSIVAAVCLTHASGAALAQAPAPGNDPARKDATEGAEAKRPPVPVAKPATPAAPEPAKAPEKHVEAEGKGETVPPGSRAARASGPLPVGSGERAFNAPDCRWTGERVIATLMRDEVDVASQLTRFYSMFGCPTPHIGLALTCMVERSAEQGPHDKKIESCWADPTVSRTAAAPAPEQAKDAAKTGGEDKPPQKN